MDIEETIITRRSIRKYSPKKVVKNDILAILEIAMWSPSACNRQAHKVIYIEDQQTKKKLADMGGAPFLKNAPVVLLFLYDDTGDNIEYRDDLQSSSALTENFLLLAHAKGFGACWVCHLPSKKNLRKLFNIPRSIIPVAAVAIGYPARKPSVVTRKHKVEEIFFKESLPSGMIVPDRNFTLFMRRTFRKCYYFLPISVQRLINPLVDKLFVKKFNN